MADMFERFARLAALKERISGLSDATKLLTSKVEQHNDRLVRLETLIEISSPEGVILRVTPRAKS